MSVMGSPGLPSLQRTKPEISLRTFQHEAGICTRLRQNWTVRSQLATY